jgi:hypothetical protein
MKSNKYWRITEPTITLSHHREDHTIGDTISFVHVDGGESIYRLVEQYEAIAFKEATATFTVHEDCKHRTKSTQIETDDTIIILDNRPIMSPKCIICTYCADCGNKLKEVPIND